MVRVLAGMSLLESILEVPSFSHRPDRYTPMLAGLFAGGRATGAACVKPVDDPGLTPPESRGGPVVAIDNPEARTDLEILRYQLDRSDRAVVHDQTQSRFLVRRTGYLQPLEYRPGREVTATGRIGHATGGIGGIIGISL